MILGVDGGNKNIKMFGENGEMMFVSALGEYRERNLEQFFSEDDIVYEFKGKKGFAGTLAENESQFNSSVMGDTKVHEEFLIRVLLGLHRYTEDTEFKLIVGQPISKHNASEKLKMKKLLEGIHEITVNDITKQIFIKQIEVAAEGGASFWSSPRNGKVRIMDYGSGTVNCATLNDGKYIDRDSFTIPEGLNTLLTDDILGLVRYVCNQAKRRNWEIDDTILLCGGGAEIVQKRVREVFPNVSILRPQIQKRSGSTSTLSSLSPIYSNAVAFYNIGLKVFNYEDKS